MYLISIYFDEETDKRIRGYMNQIAKHTGNTAMLDGKVPPHITIAAFQAESETSAKEIFWKGAKEVIGGKIQWVSVGAFLPRVIYLAPVLNEYLQELSEIYNKEIQNWEGVQSDERYQPFQWLPHTTLAKQLTTEQLKIAFEVLQNQFGRFYGKVTKIGLAKSNPYTNLEVFELE